jgi:hypothetical protein
MQQYRTHEQYTAALHQAALQQQLQQHAQYAQYSQQHYSQQAPPPPPSQGRHLPPPPPQQGLALAVPADAFLGNTYQDSESVDSQSALADLTVGHYARTPLRIADRPPMTACQKTFGGLFYGQLLVQLAACACVLATQNAYYATSLAECGPSYELDADRQMCVDGELRAQLDACVPAESLADSPTDEGSAGRPVSPLDGRRLGWTWDNGGVSITNVTWTSDYSTTTSDYSDLPARNSGLLLLLLGGTALVCLGWFLILGAFARAMTWGMLGFNVIMMFYMFYLTHNWMLLVTAALVMVVAFFARANIEVAIQAMGLASTALWSTPWTFVVCFAFRVGWFTYAVSLSCVGFFFTPNSMTVGPDCELEQSWAAAFWFACCPVLFIVTTLFFKNCMLSVVAMSVGCWYFPDAAAELQEEACGNPALYGGKLALTTSSGSVLGSALIMGVVEALKRHDVHPCWWLDPMLCAMKVLWLVLEGTVGSLTRFALIAHLFHGDGLCHMGTITKELLSRHLPDAVATGFLANVIMGQMAMGMSTSFGFLVWYLLDQREHIGVFRTIVKDVNEVAQISDDNSAPQLLVALLTWSMYLGARRPINTLFWSVILYIFAPFVSWLVGLPGLLESYLTAQFMAALASIIFDYMGSVMEYATDTVFYCMAVESESGRCDARTMKLHEAMQAQLGREEEQLQKEGRADGEA